MDKGRNILLNGYIKDKFKNVCCQLWAYRDFLLKCYLYTLIDVLLGYYILICSSNRCSAKILNLFIFKFKGKGPTRYIPLIFTIHASKQNQYSHLKTIRALYNKKPLIYMLSGLAFYLLYYQDLNNKLFLDFSKQLVWYNIRLIKSSARDYKAAFLYNLQ